MKKVYAVFLLLLLLVLIFVIQILVLNEIRLFGTVANLVLVTVVMVSLWYSMPVSCVYSAILGIITDIFFYHTLGINLIIYTLIAVVINLIAKVYRKENSVVIMYVVFIGTVAFEIAMGIISLSTGVVPNILEFLGMLLKASVLNIGLAYIVNKLFVKFTINISNGLDLYID